MKSFIEHALRIELEPSETLSETDFNYSKILGMRTCVERRQSVYPAQTKYVDSVHPCHMEGTLDGQNAAITCDQARCPVEAFQIAAASIIGNIQKSESA